MEKKGSKRVFGAMKAMSKPKKPRPPETMEAYHKKRTKKMGMR